MNPVQSFKEAPTAAKVATVAGAAAAIGSVVYAAKHGKVADTFEGSKAQKAGAVLKDGYKQLGKTIAGKATKVWGEVKAKATEAKEWVASKAPKAKEKAAEAAEDAAEAVQ
ncbi:TPA: hypothetical protein IAA92_05590 [Candidatus Galligastranaerophilus intestinigallinarum]|nr:hypothetical protein [Candidatus Galligastranaerophilus intestinigallinarum]